MAKILTAKDYHDRILIRVCLNPNDPEVVHADSNPHTGQAPAGTPSSLKPWEWCEECRYNWDVREFTWTGPERYTTTKTSKVRLKTNAELLAEVKAELEEAPPPSIRQELVNKPL